MSSRDWNKATKANPCPACGNPDWCLHDERSGLCNRDQVPEGYHDGGEQKGGGRLWFRDAPAAPNGKPTESTPAKPSLPVATSGEIDRVYRRALELLKKVPAAVAEEVAKQRGLSPERLAELGFGYLPGHWKLRRNVLDTLEREFGRTLLLKVPGFIFKGDKLDFALSGSGLLIPHRDFAGNLLALQVRLDRPRIVNGKPQRYFWLSGNGGPSAPAVPYLAGQAGGRVLLTEGAFKAIAGADRFGAFAIGLSGASMLAQALPVLKEVGAGEVLLAYDADHAELKPDGKPNHVFGWLRSAVRNLRAEGYAVSLLRWHRGLYVDGIAKGLDDVDAGAELEELEGDQVDEHLREVAELLGQAEELADSDKVAGDQEEAPLSKLETILLPLAALQPEYRGAELEAALRGLTDASKGLDPIERAHLQSGLIRHLKRIKAPIPAELARHALGITSEADKDKETGPRIQEQEPCAEPVSGANLLDQIERLLLRFAILPDGASVAIPLWLLHTYLIPYLSFTPRLAVLSPVRRCGKSRVLDLLRELCEKPMAAASFTAASIFRSMDAFRPTIIADEADTWLRDNEDLRGVVNTGFDRGHAFITRCVGDSHEVKLFDTFGAMAIAGIGRLPDTIQDRSIIISMRRKRPEETVERLRLDILKAAAAEVKPQMARWALDNAEEMRAITPDLPKALHDRAADAWEPLLAIADLAGGEWPKRARQAAVILSGADAQEEEDIRVLLLSDIRDIFERRRTDRVRTEALLEELASHEERPWREWKKGQPLSPHGLAKLLRSFGVAPKTYRDGFGNLNKGYLRPVFEDAFGRYLGEVRIEEEEKVFPLPQPPKKSVTQLQPNRDKGLSQNQISNTGSRVTDLKSDETASNLACNRVTDFSPPSGAENKNEARSTSNSQTEQARNENGTRFAHLSAMTPPAREVLLSDLLDPDGLAAELEAEEREARRAAREAS